MDKTFETNISRSAYGPTSFFETSMNDITNSNIRNNTMQRSKTLTKITRNKTRENKIYRTPPTPTEDVLIGLERSFTLDCIAVGNISEDYSRANPKLGSAIPPYDSRNDKKVNSYMNFYGVSDLLKKTEQYEFHESIPGRVHDRFYQHGHGTLYLDARNGTSKDDLIKRGNGRHPETYEGHRRFLGDQVRSMFSYNNQFGYRRNVPSLRSKPSTFTADDRWLLRLNRTFKKDYSPEKISQHFTTSYVHGFPYSDNDYKKFFPTVRYLFSVKVGSKSPDEFNENMYVNVISKSYDTGFFTLDKTNLVIIEDEKEAKEKRKSSKSARNSVKNKSELIENTKLFQSDKLHTFMIEHEDLRTVQAIIVSRDRKSERALYIESMELEIHRAQGKKIYRFPFNGWIGPGKQDKKAEDLKRRFGVKNSIVLFPNAKPKYEYKIRTYPQIFSETEYKVQLQFDIDDPQGLVEYSIKMKCGELPSSGAVILRLGGSNCDSDNIKISSNKPVHKVNECDVGDVSFISVKLQRIKSLKIDEIVVTKSKSQVITFTIDQEIRANEQKIFQSSNVNILSDRMSAKPHFNGKIGMIIEGDQATTNSIELKNPLLSSDKSSYVFRRYAPNVGNIENVYLKYNDDPTRTIHIRNIKIIHNKNIFEEDVDISMQNDHEAIIPEDAKKSKKEKRMPPQLMVKLTGEEGETDYFPLTDPSPGPENCDEYVKNTANIGTIKSAHIKYISENKSEIYVESIELLDPNGKSIKYPVDASFKSGDVSLVPKSADASQNESYNKNNNKNSNTESNSNTQNDNNAQNFQKESLKVEPPKVTINTSEKSSDADAKQKNEKQLTFEEYVIKTVKDTTKDSLQKNNLPVWDE